MFFLKIRKIFQNQEKRKKSKNRRKNQIQKNFQFKNANVLMQDVLSSIVFVLRQTLSAQCFATVQDAKTLKVTKPRETLFTSKFNKKIGT